MPPPLWLHCNVCHNRQARSWHLSSCGKVVCQDCLQRIKTTRCGDCQGPCTKSVELNSRAPKDVQMLFGDVTEEIKKVWKIIDFQEKNKASFLRAMKKDAKRLVEPRSVMRRELRRKLAEKAELKEKIKAKILEAARKKKAIKSRGQSSAPLQMLRNAATAVSSLFGTEEDVPMSPPSDFGFSSPITSPRPEPRGPAFITSTPAHISPRRHSLDRGFMELKTPAPPRKSQGGRQEEARKAPPPDLRPSPILSPRYITSNPRPSPILSPRYITSNPRPSPILSPRYITSNPAHIRHHSREFKELETPPPRVWTGERRREREELKRRSQDRSLDRIRREDRRSNDREDRRSPVVRALDKLLGE